MIIPADRSRDSFSPRPAARPEVIVDVTVEDGLLSLGLRNIGDRSAYLVRTAFDKPFTGVDGKTPIGSLRLFRKVDFMAPDKAFAHFVDELARYARRKQPMRLAATVTWRDREGTRYEDRCVHDLRLYLELRTATTHRPPQGG